MKKLFKRSVATILCLMLLLGLFAGTLSITASAATSGYYTYTVSDGTATITKFNTSVSGAITIPSKLGGYTVVSIGIGAFTNCNKLTNITIPNSVESILPYAFSRCGGLTSITLPDSITAIENRTFFGLSAIMC